MPAEYAGPFFTITDTSQATGRLTDHKDFYHEPASVIEVPASSRDRRIRLIWVGPSIIMWAACLNRPDIPPSSQVVPC
jgi:hypothetical protein